MKAEKRKSVAGFSEAVLSGVEWNGDVREHILANADKMQQLIFKAKIEKFLENFPKDAESWAVAGDEVRDLARTAREYLEDYDGVIIEPVDFAHIKNPAEWNTKGRDYILACIDRMRDTTLQKYYKFFHDFFVGEDEE